MSKRQTLVVAAITVAGVVIFDLGLVAATGSPFRFLPILMMDLGLATFIFGGVLLLHP